MAFVEMGTIEEATVAIKALNGKVIDGRTAKANFAIPQVDEAPKKFYMPKTMPKKKEEPKEEPKKEVKEEKSIYALALQYLNELKPELRALTDKYKGKGNTSQLEKEINALISTKTDNEEIQLQMKKGISGAFFRYYKG